MQQTVQERSIFVTVVGWIFIVFSGLFLLEALMFMFIPFEKFMPKAPVRPGVPAPDPAMLNGIMHGTFFVLGALSAWVLLSSIGLVMRKNWARISFIVLMVLDLIFCGLYLVFGIASIVLTSHTELPGQPPEMAGFLHSMMIVVVVFCAAFAVLYGFILYKLNTAKIRAEFLPLSA